MPSPAGRAAFCPPRISSRRGRLLGWPVVIVARASRSASATASAFFRLVLSARAGGRVLVFGCQGACGLRPPCVACGVPSCACRLRPGSRPAIIPAAALPCGPWAGSVRFRCSRLHAQHNSVLPICQALFCKKFSVRPITPLRGVKNFFWGACNGPGGPAGDRQRPRREIGGPAKLSEMIRPHTRA